MTPFKSWYGYLVASGISAYYISSEPTKGMTAFAFYFISISILSVMGTQSSILKCQTRSVWWYYPIHIFYDLFALLPVAVVTVILVPHAEPFTPRYRVMEAIGHTDGIKEEIASQLISGSTPEERKILPSDNENIAVIDISKTGKLIMVTENPGAIIYFSPIVKNNAVTWVCEGYPKKHMPVSCRGG